ncbi:expressed unknown protein [Seminavis robusta]|uniref:Uncharacterized protein n=1 Tax=Seminavis robusta TaxID=568900 RepID=A0A9N8DWR2_9STRA|nr:expressed unknown protein [Seminavis robusta]|eukprot:Sro434_g142160.1 n/a (91) ;mRNA; r:61479-61751
MNQSVANRQYDSTNSGNPPKNYPQEAMVAVHVEEVYYEVLKDPDEGYLHLQYIDLIQHLIKEAYKTVNNEDLNKNVERMNPPWTPTNQLN